MWFRAVLVGLIVLIVLATASVTSGYFMSQAEAHVSEGRNYFYWESFTRKKTNDQELGKRLDPTAIVWTSGPEVPEARQDDVRDAVNEFWGNKPSKGAMTFGQACLGQGGIVRALSDGGVQELRFREPEGAWLRDANDYQGSTSTGCLSQWHMRFWDDEEHWSNYFAEHGDQWQWAVSGVHFDRSTGNICLPTVFGCSRVGTGHEVVPRWNSFRNFAVNNAMRSLCGRSRWRHFPGQDREWRGDRMDGFIARIDFTRDTSGCPEGLY